MEKRKSSILKYPQKEEVKGLLEDESTRYLSDYKNN